MIYIAVALTVEAKPLITYFKLKKDNEIKKYQVFKNEEITLIITGSGIMQGAIAVTYVLGNLDIGEEDIFVNLGICGAVKDSFSIGDIILCNKIINNCSKKNFYPDMLFKHKFKEGTLETFFQVVDEKMEKEKIKGEIVDMEGAGICEAASLFFSQHQINIIKIVSDYLNTSKITAEKVMELVENKINKIADWLVERKKFNVGNKEIFTLKEKESIKKIEENLRLTESMYYEFLELIKYYKIQNKSIENIILKYSDIKIKDKREGKITFERIRKEIIEF
ncbi:5'-methylthioadenosine/S-adenosylhomocysteine nucleosidase family protein [Fusobacterium varium]|uniref:5'-methylthioadenosine/S-adenosylhomocysteine nucleosidase family protein n=1 Tax=Fusobacterium varium TaxID=856 RepID=UPI000E42154B|nr:spore photoproduct lyase [Fusobacterium varium]MCI6031375.1 spore photoproduct lyase [Fusobacterium varium]MDY4004859.1 spore photoproduct lyase [Fusobacterium varium]RGJ30855.1 spore photoproduct lyase [Fusobacterium varium]